MLTKVIEQAKIDHFTKWFERADKIVIVSHVSPDGDAIGSSLGLYHFLDSQEKTVSDTSTDRTGAYSDRNSG